MVFVFFSLVNVSSVLTVTSFRGALAIYFPNSYIISQFFNTVCTVVVGEHITELS